MNKPSPEEDKNREESRQGWVTRSNSQSTNPAPDADAATRISQNPDDTIGSTSDAGSLLRKVSLQEGKSEEFVDFPHKGELTVLRIW